MDSERATESSAESRLTRLIDRLLTGARDAIAAGNLDLAREMASDVLTVDEDHDRARDIIRIVDERQRSRLGERAMMTILFSDLVDSTRVADVQEPEIVRDILALYRAEAKLAVERFGGRIVNYAGDGVVASFGFPDPHGDDARRAVSAGLELIAGMEQAAARAREQHGVDAEVRVGIHTGLVVVADIGIGRATEHDAIVGVTPNLAARIQSAAAPGEVVISDVTQHIVESDFDTESLGAHTLKGIAREVELYRVVAPRHMSDRLSTARFVGAPMVGRDDEAADLTSKWRATAAGEKVRATLLRGPAGIGKSRVVAEFRARVVAAGGNLFELGCLPYYTNSALWPATQSMLKRMDISASDDAAARISALQRGLESLGLDIDPNLALLAPLIGADVVPDHPAPLLNPTALRQAVLQSLLGVIAAGAATQTRALIIEDVHWADPSTLDLVGLVIQNRPSNVMLLMTSREPLRAAWADAVDVVELGHLSEDAAHRLVDFLAGDQPLDDATRGSIVDRAAGVPLFIEELTRHALIPGSAVPARLQELLAARLREPGVDLELAQTAATVGVEFDSSLLQAVVADGSDLAERLEALEGTGIIDKLDDEGRYRFRHALLRDAAYETQVLEGRRDWHGRIAGALTNEDGDAAVIARHFDMAGSVGEAIAQYGVAVQDAQASGAHAEATQLASRALELIAQLPDGPDRHLAELGMVMLRGLSISSISGYGAPEVGADYRRASELSELLGTSPEVMPAAIAIWSFALVAGDVATASLLVNRLRARVEDGSGAFFAPEVDASLAFQALYEGDLDSARQAGERAIAGFDARPSGEMVSAYWPLPNDPVAANAVGMAVVATLQGRLADAEEFTAAAVARAEAVPFPRGPFTLAFVKVYLAWLALMLGDLDESQQLGEEVTDIGRQFGYAYWMALGSIYHRVAEPDLEAYSAAMDTLQAIGHEAFRPSYLAYLATLQQGVVGAGAALATVSDGLLEIGKSGELLHRPDLLRLRGLLTLATGGDAADALADLEQSLELAIEGGNALYALRAALDLARLATDLRPEDWATKLQAAVDRFGPSATFTELAAARELLSPL